MSSRHDKLTGTGPKKLLAIDGGGIRGVIALEALAKIENLLGRRDSRFCLAAYFDLIAGTSTGAISAGQAVAERKVQSEHFTRFPSGT
jgi:patatin-like phospholipase/acyl hydrolase